MTELNNATIQGINYIAIYDYKIVDAEQKIWRGKLVHAPAPVSDEASVFFSRKYDREKSDIDRMLDEYEIKDTTLIGAKFLLVPREKLLFGYTPESIIVKPHIKIRR